MDRGTTFQPCGGPQAHLLTGPVFLLPPSEAHNLWAPLPPYGLSEDHLDSSFLVSAPCSSAPLPRTQRTLGPTVSKERRDREHQTSGV